MNPVTFAIPTSPTVQVSAALDPIRNILLSLWAFTADHVAVEPWVMQNAAQLTPEVRRFNRLLFAAFGSALLPTENPPDFASYLASLAAEPVAAFQERLQQATASLASADLRSEAAELLVNPARLQQQLVEHLRTLWSERLAAEWQRQSFTLTGMTRSINEALFSQPRWQAIAAAEALRWLLQSELTDSQIDQLAGVRRIVLVWSPHLLAYCNRFGSDDTLWVVRKFDPQLLRRDPLSRAEVLGPLTALADDTRLRILESLTEQGEQRAQEIIALLAGSQGNVSRHLKQLVGASLVGERRAGDANKLYSFEAAGLQRLIFRLRQLLSPHNAQSVGQQRQTATQLSQVRASAPPLLHDLLDEQGRIIRWSQKLKEQQALLEYLAEKFAAEQGYSEKAVNELLQQWYLDADFVLVRRSMIDAGLLQRTKDGARYWRKA